MWLSEAGSVLRWTMLRTCPTCKPPLYGGSSIVLAGGYSSAAEAAVKAHCSVPVCVVTGVLPATGGGDGADVAPGQRLQDLAQKIMGALGVLGGGRQKPVAACRHHTHGLQA